ncbi:calcium uniporter protein 4, mitochondrial [Andrographis paniculata]|uniref:calcium uniporter protein 4, mitochondrial n=1 Tax=Andrographis paniculata TaxID=175694 RepID=UPI0021E84906|nr:calcium uniporter protein 4, mitochondrial [Andrographis paniculata]
MALRRALSKRLSFPAKLDSPSPITTVAATTDPPTSQSTDTKSQFQRGGFFRRFLQRRAINHHSSVLPSGILSLPVGESLRERIKSMNNAGDHQSGPRPDVFNPAKEVGFRIGAADVKKVLRLVKMEEIRERLRNIPANAIPYDEFVAVCADACGNTETALQFAKAFDESGNVVVLGNVVFLRPHQVAKSMEKLITDSIATPEDPRKQELETLQREKALIDEEARSKVQLELYFGLGFLGLQTLGFMRLTFWELSWDVMEPICFFATSLHFAIAYAFFLRTSKEPSFEGYFQRRFKVKQKKLMENRNFDVQRYHQLCEAFYPKYSKNN